MATEAEAGPASRPPRQSPRPRAPPPSTTRAPPGSAANASAAKPARSAFRALARPSPPRPLRPSDKHHTLVNLSSGGESIKTLLRKNSDMGLEAREMGPLEAP